MGRTERTTKETSRQVLAFIRRSIRENGYSPTLREICDGLDISSTSVAAYHIELLVKQGLITRKRGIPRSMRPTRRAKAEPESELNP